MQLKDLSQCVIQPSHLYKRISTATYLGPQGRIGSTFHTQHFQ